MDYIISKIEYWIDRLAEYDSEMAQSIEDILDYDRPIQIKKMTNEELLFFVVEKIRIETNEELGDILGTILDMYYSNTLPKNILGYLETGGTKI